MRPALSGYYLQQNWINAQIVPTRIFKSSNLPPRRTQKIWFLYSDMQAMFEDVVQYSILGECLFLKEVQRHWSNILTFQHSFMRECLSNIYMLSVNERRRLLWVPSPVLPILNIAKHHSHVFLSSLTFTSFMTAEGQVVTWQQCPHPHSAQ